MTFGEKLQGLRRARGLSQEQLAEKINVSRQALSRWELGTTMPDTEHVLQLSKLFFVSTDYLLNDALEDSRSPLPGGEAPTGKPGKPRRKMGMIVGISFIGTGVVGNLLVLILSTLIQVTVITSTALPSGYTTSGIALGYSLKGFVETYNLQAVLFLLLLLMMIGVMLIVDNWKKNGI